MVIPGIQDSIVKICYFLTSDIEYLHAAIAALGKIEGDVYRRIEGIRIGLQIGYNRFYDILIAYRVVIDDQLAVVQSGFGNIETDL